MYFKRYLLMSFFLCGCWIKSPSDSEYFYSWAYLRWPFAAQITAAQIGQPKQVDTAVMAWQLLAEMKMIGPQGKSNAIDCLFYRMPFVAGKKYGILKVVSAFEEGKCQELESRPERISLNNIEQLQLAIHDQGNKEEKNNVSNESYTMRIQIKILGQNEESWIFPLYNLKKGHLLNPSRKFSLLPGREQIRFSSSAIQRKKEGMSFWPAQLSGENLDEEFSTLGDKDSDFVAGSLILCHQVDEQCQTIGTYQCESCRFGWFEAVGTRHCPGGGPKFCRPNHCGERGWPACVRGYEFSGLSTLPTCFDGSIAGYCQEGLSTYCQNATLVCL